MSEKILINAKHLKKNFGQESALKDINFEVKAGEIFGFLGPSGAGKTTTIKLLTGQLANTAGSAQVLGQSINDIDEVIYRKIGIVTHNSGIYERMSVYDNLLFFAKIFNVDSSRVDELLQQVGLYEQRKKMAAKLSQGMKQRLIFARAILHEPTLLFLDEPTNGLDPGTSEAIHRLILGLKRRGTGIFLTTHNMTEATKLCDRVALLNDGLIVETGSPNELSMKYNRKQQFKIQLKDGRTFQLNQTPDTAITIYQWFKEKQIATIHSEEPTLEEVFLEVTGRELA